MRFGGEIVVNMEVWLLSIFQWRTSEFSQTGQSCCFGAVFVNLDGFSWLVFLCFVFFFLFPEFALRNGTMVQLRALLLKVYSNWITERLSTRTFVGSALQENNKQFYTACLVEEVSSSWTMVILTCSMCIVRKCHMNHAIYKTAVQC